MIVVTVELQSAKTGQKTVLGRAIIHNVATTPDGRLADYEVRVGRKTDSFDLVKVFNRPIRRGQVLSHPRLSQIVWRLVLKALASAFPEQKVTLPDEDVHDIT